MRINELGQSILDDKDLFRFIYQGRELTSQLVVEPSNEIEKLEQELGFKFSVSHQETQTDFDSNYQSIWHMPDDYKTLDIFEYIRSICPPWDPEHSRVEAEIKEFMKRDMTNLLRWLKYFVDTARANNIVWGVGRGSSVASYVLYLIGVHKINSVKYNLDHKEFFR